MRRQASEVPDDRDLTAQERSFVRWLIEHGDAPAFLGQLDRARVCSRCSCGCASICFSIGGETPRQQAMKVISDFQWQDLNGCRFGAFVFVQGGLLAGLDLWSIDGQATPSALPHVESLVSIGPLIQA
jgi:hypothetical protein